MFPVRPQTDATGQTSALVIPMHKQSRRCATSAERSSKRARDLRMSCARDVLTDIAHWQPWGGARRSLPRYPPGGDAVAVSRLIDPAMLVEIEA